jgi:hypothetical protein
MGRQTQPWNRSPDALTEQATQDLRDVSYLSVSVSAGDHLPNASNCKSPSGANGSGSGRSSSLGSDLFCLLKKRETWAPSMSLSSMRLLGVDLLDEGESALRRIGAGRRMAKGWGAVRRMIVGDIYPKYLLLRACISVNSTQTLEDTVQVERGLSGITSESLCRGARGNPHWEYIPL